MDLETIQNQILLLDFFTEEEILSFLKKYEHILVNVIFALGYCRYSSSLQDEKSIEQQKNELLEYAKKNNILIIKFYCDEAKTGTKDDREEFQALITDACKFKIISQVLVWKTDRFARNTSDNLYYRNKLNKHFTRLVSITQPIDDSTPEGALMSTLLASMDEYYSKNLASNVRRAQKLKAKKLEFQGGIPPLRIRYYRYALRHKY